MSEPIRVLMKDGTSYFEKPYTSAEILVNGAAPAECKGNPRWVEFYDPIETIEREDTAAGPHTGFSLRERFRGVVSLPETVPLGTFEYDSEDYEWRGPNVELYEPAYGPTTTKRVKLPFIVIDRNAEPAQIPSYVKVDFPHDLKQYPEVHHKYPCSIHYEAVYPFVSKAIRERIKGQDQYWIDNFDNIQTLTLSLRIKPVAKTVVGRAKKKRKTDDGEWQLVEILSIVGKYERRGNAIQLEAVRGNNLAECLANLKAYVATFVAMIDNKCYGVCDKCKGEGVIETT